MNKIIALMCLLVAVCYGAPSALDAARRALPALTHQEIHDQFGQYALHYVTAEGTVVCERGRLVPNPEGGHVMVYEGQTTHVADGKTFVTKYRAGFDGFHAEGTHLTAPDEASVVGDEY